MSKYIEAEKRLAELLGAKDITVTNGTLFVQVPDEFEEGEMRSAWLPHWCRDDAAAFRMMVEYSCYVAENGTGSVLVPGPKWSGCIASTVISGHPDKVTAIRYVIVMAVIAKLESES